MNKSLFFIYLSLNRAYSSEYGSRLNPWSSHINVFLCVSSFENDSLTGTYIKTLSATDTSCLVGYKSLFLLFVKIDSKNWTNLCTSFTSNAGGFDHLEKYLWHFIYLLTMFRFRPEEDEIDWSLINDHLITLFFNQHIF